MAFVHGKITAISIDGDDLSAYGSEVKFSRTADTHDVTTFGKTSKVYVSGLKDGTATVSGIYDDTALVSPGVVLRPLIGGAAVPLVYKPEGGASGKPTATVDVIVSKYEETAPVADMITWSCELQLSDDITDGTVSP